MSEEEVVVDEIEEVEETEEVDAEEIEAASNVESVVDAIMAGDYNAAGEHFNDEMMDRIGDALDAKRVEVGSSMTMDPGVDGETDESEYEYEEQSEEETIDDEEAIN